MAGRLLSPPPHPARPARTVLSYRGGYASILKWWLTKRTIVRVSTETCTLIVMQYYANDPRGKLLFLRLC